MAFEKRKRHTFTSPKGTFVFPKLHAPDYGNKEYPKPDGEYSVKLRLHADSSETKAFIAKLEPFYKAALAAAAEEFKGLKAETRKKIGTVKSNDLFTECLDKETEEPTGEIEFKFAMKASGIAKKEQELADKEGRAPKRWNRKPSIFDAKGVVLRTVPEIGGGSVGRVSFEIEEGGYFIKGTGVAGLKLALAGAQIIELRSGGEKSAKEHGFGEEEGYEAESADKPQEDDATFSEESADQAGSGDTGDF